MRKVALLSMAVALLSAAAYAQPPTWSATGMVNYTVGVGTNAVAGTYNPVTGNVYLSPQADANPVKIMNPQTGAAVGNLNTGTPDVRAGNTLGLFALGAGDDGIVYGIVGNAASAVRWANEAAVPTVVPFGTAPSGGIQFARVCVIEGSGASKRGYITGSQDNSGFQVLNLAEPLGANIPIITEMGNRAPNSGISKNSLCANAAGNAVWGGTGSQIIRKALLSGTTWTTDTVTFISATLTDAAYPNGMVYDATHNIVLGINGNNDNIFAVNADTGLVVGTTALGANIHATGGGVSGYGSCNITNLTSAGGTVIWTGRDGVTGTVTAAFGRFNYTTNAGVGDWFIY